MTGVILPRDLGGRGADPVVCWVYDPNLLELVRMTQPVINADTIIIGSPIGVTGPLTDDELRATPVDVAGDWLTDTELRAADVKVTLDSEIVGINQVATADANNSSTANLTSENSYTFTGSKTSTLGVAAIQVSMYADQDCIVKVEQSPDDTPHWDLVDKYYYKASGNFGKTIQAISSYVRVVVSTAGATTTEFRLQTVLCPIAEPMPRSLDGNGNLKVASPVDEYGWSAENTPMGDMRIVEPFRLVGATFEGTTIDANYWTTASTDAPAAIAQANAQLLMTSGTANGATVTAYSVRRARYVGGSAMRYRAVVQAGADVANNNRRWGIGYGASMPTITDGAWFTWQADAFKIQVMKGTSATTITTFNGHLGTSWVPGTGAQTYEIYWTNSKVYFTVGGELLHTHSASSATWASTMNFHVFMDSVNTNTATSTTLAVRVATIYRLGKIETAPQWKNFNTTAVTASVLKRGPGRLHRVTFNTIPNSTVVSLYDAITATNPICIMNPPNGTMPFAMDFGLDFYTGLCITTTPNACDVTVIYE